MSNRAYRAEAGRNQQARSLRTHRAYRAPSKEGGPLWPGQSEFAARREAHSSSPVEERGLSITKLAERCRRWGSNPRPRRPRESSRRLAEQPDQRGLPGMEPVPHKVEMSRERSETGGGV